MKQAPALLAIFASTYGAAGGDARFSDQSENAGLLAIQASPGDLFTGGGCVGDFNQDGHEDVFFCGGANADALFLNQGDGTFQPAVGSGLDVTIGSNGAAAADYDRDGDLDLLVTVYQDDPGLNRLYRNNGDGTFTDIASSVGLGLNSPNWSDGWGGAWSDYDLDGDLDLAVAAGIGGRNRLFRNDNGIFTDVIETGVGLAPDLLTTCGFAPRFADFNGDLAPELLWVGCFSNSHYFINDGDGTFTEWTRPSGSSQSGSEMGVAVADFDADGLMDYYVTTIRNNRLYRNLGGHAFEEVAVPAGADQTGWGWACDALDFDHDGRVDLLVTSQDVGQFAFQNVKSPGGPLLFEDVSAESGFVSPVSGRGLATFDYDGDGDRDAVIFAHGEPLRLLRNDLVAGPDTHWLTIVLDPGAAETIPTHGIGSRVELVVGERTHVGTVSGGSNYLSQSSLDAHFGLGTASVVDVVRVRWTDGTTTELFDVPTNQTVTVTAGCAADLTGDGAVSILDLLEYLDGWLVGPREIEQLLAYLEIFFEGC